jgi:hypothetical protein
MKEKKHGATGVVQYVGVPLSTERNVHELVYSNR